MERAAVAAKMTHSRWGSRSRRNPYIICPAGWAQVDSAMTQAMTFPISAVGVVS